MVYLISIYERRLFFEDLGANRIAAFLEEKSIPYKFRYIKCNSDISEAAWAEIINSDFVGISVYDNNIDFADTIAARIKKERPDVVVFYGSQYASIAYKDILENSPDVDCVILGDGEFTVLDLVNTTNQQERNALIAASPYLVSKGMYRGKKCRVSDIKELPWPKYNKEYYKKNLHIDLNSASGCAGNCSFCGSLRRTWSGREPRDICAHIKKTITETNIHSFYFSDSSFEDPGILGKKRIDAIADAILQDNIKCSFSANIRAESFQNCLHDKALLKKLNKAGFSQLFIGVESGNDTDLCIYNKRARVQDNKNAISLLQEVGIEPFWGFIMFNPYSSLESLSANCDFLLEMETYIAYHYVSYLTIYNGTSIYDRTLRDGLLVHTGRNHITYNFLNPEVALLFQWIKNNILESPLLNVIKQTRDFFHFYYYVKPIVPNLAEEFEERISKAKMELHQVNREFFNPLFKLIDMETREELFASFDNRTNQIWCDLKEMQMRMLKKYYDYYR